MPTGLDPLYYTSAAASRVGRLIYEKLVDFDDQMRPRPALADWVTLSDTHYRFRLRDTTKRFHDGTALTAADVKATYEFILDPQRASPHRAAIAPIARIETPSKHEIDFFLKYPDPLFPSYLTMGIVPKSRIVDHQSLETNPIGSGPFRFVEWSSDERIRLQRISDNQLFEFVLVQNPTVRALKLMRGEIDIAQNDMPPELITHLAEHKGIKVTRGDGSNFSYIGFNMEDPILKDQRVRLAIAHAIDREAIIKYVFKGGARPANAIFPPNHWAGMASLEGYKYDPEKAKALLHEAGISQKLKLIYKTSNDPFRVRLVTVLQHQLSKVGIELDIRSYDFATFYGDIKAGRFQLFSLAWIGIKTPDIFEYAFHSRSLPPQGANRGRFADAKIDDLIDMANHKTKISGKLNLYRDIQIRLLEQLPYIPLWYEENITVVRNDIVGYQLSSDGDYDGLINTKRIP